MVCLISYAMAAMKDPGVIFNDFEMVEPIQTVGKQDLNTTGDEGTYSEIKTERFCLVCNKPQEVGTEHCSDCELCIRGYDHHCPWTGKCIGEGNFCVFCVFVGSLFASFILVVISIAVSLGTISP